MGAGFAIDDKSAAFLDALEGRARKVMRKVGKEAVAEAKDLVPKDKGDLAKSIGLKVTKKGDDLILEVGAKDWKAHWHEGGTEKMKKTPFLGPATEKLGEAFGKELGKEARKIRV